MAEGNGDVVVELLRAGAEQDKKDDDDKLWWQTAPSDRKVIQYVRQTCEAEGIELKIEGEEGQA
ncbi:hypothetical protein TWF694_007905 [Orbilia ellipsospora]|uniref:Ankyrin repeat protein n=1 Tax=Orbilia ellipsospora TaxID=2528407 RepID=A0AAV9XJ73_9PEZI